MGSATPGSVFKEKAVSFVPKSSKSIPVDLDIKRFKETKVTAYRIKKAV